MNNLIDFKDLSTQIVSGLVVLLLVGLVGWLTGFFKRRRVKINLKLDKLNKLNKLSKWPTVEKQFKQIHKAIRKEQALEGRNKTKRQKKKEVMSMTKPDIYWTGKSGHKYGYWIHPIGTEFKKVPGNYIFAKETRPSRWRPLYIGQTKNLDERLETHEMEECAERNGATHIHAHTSSSDEDVRRAEEADLITKWKPICNVQGT